MSSPALSPEYAQFRQTFFAESAEMLADMEGKLERLSAHGLDREELDAVFRAVHSIKAGAGMFNYGHLVSFAHAFETLLDRMRDGRMHIDAVVAGLIIRAADVLSELVSAAQEGRSVSTDVGADVARDMLGLMNDGITAPASAAIPGFEDKPLGKTVWKIGFTPRPEMLRHANEPLLIIRELATLGDLTTICDASRVPPLESLDVEDACLAWRFELVTDRGEAAVREVFEFVEDDATITIEADVAQAEADQPVVTEDDDGFGLWTTPVADAPSPKSEEPGAAAGTRQGGPASIRVDLSRVDRLVNMVGELIIAQAMHRQQIAHLGDATGLDALEALTRELQDCVMSVRMQPVRSAFARIPRLVREVSAKLGKSVRLIMSGEQTELDKTVIEELSDPLTHMIRNSLDHGIETAEARLAAGKVAEGTIRLSAAHVGSNILIQIEDDGAGINRTRLYNKAVEKGIVSAGAKLSDDEIVDLIFAPGFSTAAAVSDVSGRGVGMDVVRRNIQKMGGRIQVTSVEGQGTRFSLIIPLTLAVLDGMLVAVGQERYIIPLTSIIETFRPEPAQIRELAGGRKVASVRGDYVRVMALHRMFGVPDARHDPCAALVVLIETASGDKIGLVVDELLGQQQVVIKSLQENFSAIAGISGATILGDGNVALILDIEQLGDLAEGPAAIPFTELTGA